MVDTAPLSPIDPGNTPMRDFWGGSRGQSWVRRSVAYDGQLRAYTGALMDALKPVPGEHCLDVGCGTGYTTRELAVEVTPAGAAVGVDLSHAMVAGARAAAGASGAERNRRPSFAVADVQVADLAALNQSRAYNVIASRFGIMFFADPVAAFTNLASAAAPGARLGLVCWAALQDNPWFTEPRDAALPILEHVLAAPPAEPPRDAPGPFSMADPTRPTDLLERAGWTNASVRTLTNDLYLGGPGSVESTVNFLTSGSAMAPTLHDHPELLEPMNVVLRKVLAPHHDGTGVRYPATAHLVTATRP